MKLLDGDNVLYHYFKQDLVAGENPESQVLMKRLLRDLSIWLPIKIYQKLPVLLPFVVRDSRCRRAVNKTAEEWGTCNADGYFRDDNTLIKSIPRSFRISSRNVTYKNYKLGKGFIASHIWRIVSDSSKLASEDPYLNSFIPNLVWLPRQISKFTDREGSFAQRYIQALSHSIYRDVKLDSEKRDFVANIWNRISVDRDIDIADNDIENLNFFHMTNEDIEKKVERILTDIDLIKHPQKQRKLYCSRYLPSLEMIRPSKKSQLIDELEKYTTIIK